MEIRNTASPELRSALEIKLSTVDRIAIGITEFLGNMKFLIGCIMLFIIWITWNVRLLPFRPFDPFPFPILEMMVSIFAIILSVSVLINQNRQGRIEKVKQQVEFEINVRAEEEITRVLIMLHEIHQHLGLDTKQHDQELENMKAVTDIHQIHQTLNDKEEDESKNK